MIIQKNPAENIDRINLLFAVGAVALAFVLFESLLPSDVSQTGFLQSIILGTKILLSLIVVWLLILVIGKTWKEKSKSFWDQYSSIQVLKSLGISWGITFLFMYQYYDRLLGESSLVQLQKQDVSLFGNFVCGLMLFLFGAAYLSQSLYSYIIDKRNGEND